MFNEGQKMVICSICGCVIDTNEAYEYEGEFYCNSCFNDEFVVCDECGRINRCVDMQWSGDCFVCGDCLVDNYVQCDNCGDWVRLCDINEDENGLQLCNSCLTSDYYVCSDCGCYVRYTDVIHHRDDSYCPDCYDRHSFNGIQRYGYKPDPIFYGQSSIYNHLTRYMGVELEIDKGGYDEDAADTLSTIANEKAEHLYIKEDGSLSDGFELVTHPMTLEYHLSTMPWGHLCDNAIDMGYRSHDTETCGLHIHVNRQSFGNDFDTQYNNIAKVIYLVESFWDKFVHFSRRNYKQIGTWCNKYGKKHNVQEQKNDFLKCNRRYHAVNVCNRHTIEFRLFRGTLNVNTLFATLEMVDFLCTLVCNLTDSDIEALDWETFVHYLKYETNDRYSYVMNYLSDSGLV